MSNHRCWKALLIVSLCALWAAPISAWAQGSKDDYERAQSLQQRTRGKVYADRITANWLNDGKQFWYVVKTGPNQQHWVLVDAEKGQRREAFDHKKMAAALSEAGGKKFSADNLPITSFNLSADLTTAHFSALGKRWQCDLADYKLKEAGASEEEHSTVTVLDRPRPSQSDGPNTTVRFVNRTPGTIKLVWIDASGERSEYGAIEPNKDFEQNTYAGHVWVALDANDRPMGIFQATEKPGVAIVDGSNRFAGAGRGGFRGRRGGGPPDGRALSPDGKWRADIQDHNLIVHGVGTDENIKLTTDGTADDPYVARYYWSPDSKYLAAIQEKVGENRQIHFIESSPRDQVQPKLHTLDYAKPGDKLPVARPRLFDIAGRKQIAVSEELFPNAWSITDVHWQPDSKRFMFLYNQRGHQVLRIMGVDAASGEAKAIVDEHSDTFIDYADKQFSQYLDDTHELIWMSERDGWNHLYLYNVDSGEVKKQITRGPWVVRAVDYVDTAKRQIWFRAGGIHAEQDPYYVHFCRVNFDGTDLVVLTAGDGTHEVDFSPDRRFLVDTYSRVDMPPVTELRRCENGSLVCSLERADWTALLDTGWRPPERFVAKGRDGQADIYGIIHRPTKFDPEKKYPVIEKIYAGPQGAFVPKNFAPYYEGQAMAELGFIVVQIDGMGTNLRSKAFHNVCWKNLGDAGFPDRILWMKAAAEKYPEMDLTRIGIYGTSAGGQSALRALLADGNFYKAAVADSGCHDNRMDKVWWNELWMGWPLGPEYAEQSNVTQAKNLKGKLLLIVGEEDTNVDPTSTMQVVNALIKADKDFELLVVPGANHGVGASTPYGVRRTRDFFVRSLLNKEPRWVNQTSTSNEANSENDPPTS
ncbi:MAG TPA: DPP IV N-terminal domain-containing protein [Pirellulales bacterium]|jgi:dipeptidyl aminopeptidase/acylaminoacyl peptidase|nr:DPP IV N-terminal domain-containing protein [Pirellulales bacterium]